ncbi:MAG: helix-turn-helix transcriptional regulator [Acidimicrobiia bacterium]
MAGKHRHRFVGRAEALADLEEEVRRSAQGQFRCVMMVGEAGIGKTRLSEESVAQCEASASVLWARARPLSATASFGLWAEALERHLQHRSVDEISQLCGGQAGDLGSLLHSVAVARGTTSEPPRPRLLGSLASLLANLSGLGPLVFVFDDVHQADASSWDALVYLAGALPAARILVIAIARPGELASQPSAMRVLFDLEELDVLRRLTLEPLDDAGLRQLAEDVLAGPVGKDVLDWLWDRSRGVPLYAIGLLHALNDEGGDPGRPGLRSLPEELAARVRVRLAQLDDGAQAVLEVLAVAGGHAELGELVRFTGSSLEDLSAVVDKLVRSRLLVEVESGRVPVYEITHPVIEETIYDQIGGARRFALHRHVGRTLLIAGRLGEAALHFSRSATRGDAEAIQVLLEALRQSEERGAYPEVLKILGSLVDVVPAGDPCWRDVADALFGGADWVVDHRADDDARAAVAALREIDAVLADDSDLARRAAVKSRLTSFLSWGTGQTQEAAVAAADAVDLYTAAGQSTQARLATLELAYARGLGGDIPALRQGALDVLTQAEADSDDEAALWAVGVYGTACFYQGDFAEAERATRRSVALARAHDKPYRVTWGLMSLGWSLGYEGRLDEAYEAFEAAKQTPAWRESNVLELEANVRWLAGDFHGSLEYARQVVMLNPDRVGFRRGHCLSSLALSGVEVGELGHARRAVATARRLYGSGVWFMASGLSRHAEGVLACREGQLAEGAEILRRAAAELVDVGAPVMAAFVLLDLTELYAESGLDDHDGAAQWAVDTLAGIAQVAGRDLYRGAHQLGRAWANLAGGQVSAAADTAAEAVRVLRPLAYPVLTARALAALGTALEGRDPAGSVAALGEAAEALDLAGAGWRRDRVLARLRRSGRTGRQAAGAVLGAQSLTGRELEVARLAAQRYSSADIAARLYISRRTVEAHLASVYGKLGVHSRAGLAEKLAEASA